MSLLVIQTAQAELPARRMASQVAEMIARHRIILLTGETGCGKTTQVPQILLEQAAARCVGKK